MYLVKVKYTAKANNPNFAGQTRICYFGKGEHFTEDDGAYFSYFIKHYGYKRMQDAKRNYQFKFTDDEIYWDKDVSVIEV